MIHQKQVSQERFEIIRRRYEKLQDTINNHNQEPVIVYDPLTPKQLQELELIREVSRNLQAKKEEDMRRVAQAKEENKVAEEQKKESKEAVEQEETKKEE